MQRPGLDASSHGSDRSAPRQAEVQQVTVLAYAGSLAPPSRDRIRQLRRNLVESMRDARTMKRPAKPRPEAVDEPAGFVGEVARAACALCQGWCCSKGGEHAYLDGRSMARVRRTRPELDAWGILRLYTQAVADPGYAGSCLFHGAQGCTLDRSLRGDLCNRYFCTGLGALVKQATPPRHAMVVAERDRIHRESPVLSSAAESGSCARIG